MNQRKRGFPKLHHWFLIFSLGFTVALGGATLIAYGLAGDIYRYQDTVDLSRLPRVDAIVCLAGGRGRITAAGDLWRKYVDAALEKGHKVPVLYFSGVGPQASWHQLSRQIRPVVFQGLHAEDIVIEKESSNTYTNAQWLARHAREQGWRRILLLTSTYHMKRARFIFESVLKNQESPIEVETLSVYQEPFDAKGWRTGPNGIRVTIFEYLKWVYYQWTI